MRALTRADEQFNERSAGTLRLLRAWRANDAALTVSPVEATGEVHTEGATLEWSPLSVTVSAGQSVELMTPLERQRAELAPLLDPFNAALDAALLRFHATLAPILDKTERWMDELDPADWFRQWRIDTDTAGWPIVTPSAVAAALLMS
jgi:hypothetical protein